MFDVTSRVSYRSTPFWYRDLTRASGDIPIVLCCNKIESTDRKVKASVIKYHHKINVPLCEMSVKANYNVEQPLLFLARKLLHKDDLVFVAGPALGPPEVWRTEEDLTRQGRELELALNTPFPTEREEEEDIDMDAELKDLRWFSVGFPHCSGVLANIFPRVMLHRHLPPTITVLLLSPPPPPLVVQVWLPHGDRDMFSKIGISAESVSSQP
eukprot:gene34116-44080_t